MKTFTTFQELSLPQPLAAALEKMNFIQPTPVQAASLPPALSGKDVLGTAQTGTGKTGAFGIPLMARLHREPGTKAIVIAPTRELAAQIFSVLTQLASGTKIRGALLVGGEPFGRQKGDVKAGASFLVCTPGRLLDHLDAGLTLNKVCVLVLDEVDRMLDMGFAPQLQQIVPHIPVERQTFLFSATLPKEILAIANTYLNDPVRISIGATTQPTDRVKQENFPTSHLDKNALLMKHMKERTGRALIFVRTQIRAERALRVLERNNIPAVLLHGGRTQGQRKDALACFRSGSHPVMVATDLAGRGIDVDDIELVVNYDLPANREDYIHRIGRTARNGKTGRALNYLVPDDRGGRGIIQIPEEKVRTKPNDPGHVMGGWEKNGGRHRPQVFHRQGEDRYVPRDKRFKRAIEDRAKTGTQLGVIRLTKDKMQTRPERLEGRPEARDFRPHGDGFSRPRESRPFRKIGGQGVTSYRQEGLKSSRPDSRGPKRPFFKKSGPKAPAFARGPGDGGPRGPGLRPSFRPGAGRPGPRRPQGGASH